jgi:hypothetical protein
MRSMCALFSGVGIGWLLHSKLPIVQYEVTVRTYVLGMEVGHAHGAEGGVCICA